MIDLVLSIFENSWERESFHWQGGGKRPTERGNAGAALVMKTGDEPDRNVNVPFDLPARTEGA